jgi:hypothetical protein
VKTLELSGFVKSVDDGFKEYMKGFEWPPPSGNVCYLYWDVENCQLAKKTSVNNAVEALKKIFECHSNAIQFRVAFNPANQKTTLTEKFEACQIYPIHVGPEPDAADNALISCMIEDTKPSHLPATATTPGIIVLISSDGKQSPGGGFVAQLKRMRNISYFIVLLHQETVHCDLIPLAHVRLPWASLRETMKPVQPLKAAVQLAKYQYGRNNMEHNQDQEVVETNEVIDEASQETLLGGAFDEDGLFCQVKSVNPPLNQSNNTDTAYHCSSVKKRRLTVEDQSEESSSTNDS